jgi:hypothetical protein
MNYRRVAGFERLDAHMNSGHRPGTKFIRHIPESADFAAFGVVPHPF